MKIQPQEVTCHFLSPGGNIDEAEFSFCSGMDWVHRNTVKKKTIFTKEGANRKSLDGQNAIKKLLCHIYFLS